MTLSNHPDYRPDIDGLRAIAVLSVVAFHAFPKAVTGGFVGVDIFFVISGFLISSILLKSLDGGSFTFWDFYSRRIRRIFPALLAVLVACFAFGWYALLVDEFEVLGQHISAGALFLSNVLLWEEVDYFDTRAELKPLLHLWSLGVEEQFYIVWPLILALAWRFRTAIPVTILVIFVASFVLNISTVEEHPAAAFYLPFARFWQLLAGSLLAYYTLLRNDTMFARGAHPRLRAILAHLPIPQPQVSSRRTDTQSIAGAVLIVVSVFGIDRLQPFPGWLALLPVCGAVLLISAGPQAWFNRLVLSRGAMVFVGLISYPLYLWHWPLLSFSRILERESPQLTVILVAVSFLLAWATYRFIEIPIRMQKSNPAKVARSSQMLLAALAVMLLLGLATWQSLLPGRLDQISRDIALARSDWNYQGDGVVGDSGAGTILFFGDSYMRQYRPRVEELSRSTPWSGKTLLFKTEAGCAPFSGINRLSIDCNAWVLEGDRLADQDAVEAIVLAASWASALNRGDYFRAGDSSRTIIDLHSKSNDWVYSLLEKRVQGWVNDGKRVYIILAHPAGAEADPSGTIANRLGWNPVELHRTISLAKHRENTAFVHSKLLKLAANTGAIVIDPALWLCQGDVCETQTATGTPLYTDASHLRASFVRSAVHYLDDIVGSSQ